MTEPRFGIDRRALVVLCGIGVLAVVSNGWPTHDPLLPGTLPPSPPPFDPKAPSYPVDLAAPPANVGVTILSDTDLAARAITRHRLGEVAFPSGAIVAADPIVQPERPAFARKVPPGRYAITLYEALGRNALLELRIAPGTPVRWQLALIPGQDARTLKRDETFGYPVDAGLGTLMDVVARDALLKRDREDRAQKGDGANFYDDIVAAPLEAAGNTELLFEPYPGEPAVPIVQSGWGDGFYSTYWGLDASGRPLLLVTDFEVLENGDGHPPKADGKR